MTHRHGVGVSAIHRLALDVFQAAGTVAERQGLYGAKQDLLKSEFPGNIQGMGPGVAEMEIIERPAEPFMVLTADKTEPGAFNLLLYLTFCDPMYCSGLLLSPDIGKGFTFTIVDVDYTEADREITLSAPEDLYDLAALLRDTGRFVIRSIVSRAHPEEQAAALSTTRLKHIAGRYVGKDDPVAIVRTQKIFPATEEFGLAFSKVPYVAGNTRGSHNMPLAPVPLNTDSSIFYCLPMVSAAGYSMREGILTGPMDLFRNPVWDVFRDGAVRKGAEMRSQGFFNPAMLGDGRTRVRRDHRAAQAPGDEVCHPRRGESRDRGCTAARLGLRLPLFIPRARAGRYPCGVHRRSGLLPPRRYPCFLKLRVAASPRRSYSGREILGCSVATVAVPTSFGLSC